MPKIAGMSLGAERPHNKYGSAILIRDDLKVDNVYERVQGTVELITIVMSGVVVHSVYKPPNDQFALPALGHRDLSHIVIGDVNSQKSIMDPIPQTQHRPICVSAHPAMPPQTIHFRRRFNLMKADWNGYSAELDKLIEDVEPIPANYKCFVESVRVASRRHIPRGCRTEYVPSLTDESMSLYEAYKFKY